MRLFNEERNGQRKLAQRILKGLVLTANNQIPSTTPLSSYSEEGAVPLDEELTGSPQIEGSSTRIREAEDFLAIVDQASSSSFEGLPLSQNMKDILQYALPGAILRTEQDKKAGRFVDLLLRSYHLGIEDGRVFGATESSWSSQIVSWVSLWSHELKVGFVAISVFVALKSAIAQLAFRKKVAKASTTVSYGHENAAAPGLLRPARVSRSNTRYRNFRKNSKIGGAGGGADLQWEEFSPMDSD